MFGGGLNPRKLQQMMEQMGIDVTDIEATEVLIRTEDGEELAFDAPEVTMMEAQGQRTYQIVGDPETRDAGSGGDTAPSESQSAIPESDVEIVAERTGATPDTAREALEATDGDLAAAIDRLS